MRNSTVVILLVAATILAALAFRESRAARQARAALATAVTERDGLRERVAQLEEQQQRVSAENASLREAATRPPPDTAPEVRRFNTAGPRDRGFRPLEVFDSPEVRQLMALQQKAMLDGQYAALFRALHLSPPQLERLKQLLVDKQNAPMDVLAAARRQDLLNPAGRTEVDALIQAENEAIDRAIRDLLGPAGFEEYQDYERTRGPRTIVEQLASRLSYSAQPLSPQQASALVDLLAAESAAQPASRSSDPAAGMRVAVSMGSVGMSTVISSQNPGEVARISDATLAGAESVLSETQLAALRELQAEQLAQNKMSELIRQSLPGPRARSGDGTAGAAVSIPVGGASAP